MKVVNTVKDLQAILNQYRTSGGSVGFVPTMGALHAGHLSLVRECASENDICVVSIFVNPTQFNNKTDLEKYPRNIGADMQLLEGAGATILFAPDENEIYPEPDLRQFDFGNLETVMEGEHRPGHFNGVAQVVSRLFDIVKPDKAYFGEKDFQQLAIIRAMVKQLGLSVEIVPMPIVREPTGLAMSSRNERLTEGERVLAANISKVLFESRDRWMSSYSLKELKEMVEAQIKLVEGLEIEYFDIVDGHSLQPIQKWNESQYVIGCIAVFCGEVRLIDNIIYKADL